MQSKERLQRGFAIVTIQEADEVLGGGDLSPALSLAAANIIDWELRDLEIADIDMQMAEILKGVTA